MNNTQYLTPLLRDLADSAANGIMIVDPAADFEIIFCNPAGAAFFCRPVAEMLRQPLRVIDSRFATVIRDRTLAATKSGSSEVLETDFCSLSGAVVHAEVALNRLSHEGRDFLGLTLGDVTEERHLAELVAEMQSLAHIGGWEYRIQENRLEWSDEVYRIHDLLVGTPVTVEQAIDFYHPESRPHIERAFRDCMERGEPWRLKLRLVTAQGRNVWVQANGRAELMDGRPWRINGTFQDITAEYQAELALQESGEQLREQAMLLDAATDAIVLRSPDHIIQYWNRGAERMLGWAREEALQRNAFDLHRRECEIDQEAVRAVLHTGAWAGDIVLVNKSGQSLTAASRWTLICHADGTPKGILEINSNVTEKRKVEAGLVRAQRLESIGTLAGGIAHDLNNILAPIILSADILGYRARNSDDAELVESIGKSARRGADVVRQVLSFARGAESTRAPVNLRHLFSEIRRMIQETFPRNIGCHVTTSRDLWLIHADPTQIHQVLMNLCVNARDAMPEGGNLKIEATNAHVDATFAGLIGEGSPGPHVLIKVSDDGTGIDESIRARIFDPFFTTKDIGAGTGLGLSTVLAIVRGHRGFLKLDSQRGQGTTFSIYFPAEPHSSDAGRPPAAPVEWPRGKGECILVIDDEKTVCSIVTQGLESVGYRVVTAANGAEGLAVFSRRQSEISLVLTDLMMPVMDGVATIRALRGIAPQARIVVMSGISSGAEPIGPPVDSSSHTQFLLKPFTLDSLLQAVRESLDEQTVESGPLP